MKPPSEVDEIIEELVRVVTLLRSFAAMFMEVDEAPDGSYTTDLGRRAAQMDSEAEAAALRAVELLRERAELRYHSH